MVVKDAGRGGGGNGGERERKRKDAQQVPVASFLGESISTVRVVRGPL